MSIRPPFAALAALALAAGGIALGSAPLQALTERPQSAFPASIGELYAALDRADLSQYRELYASVAALDAIRDGKPLPTGTELTMVTYAAQRDDAGVPEGDGQGRFVRGDLIVYLYMRKGGGEAEFGHWRFQVFGPDKRVDPKAKLADCAACHQKRSAQDFIFTRDWMKTRPSAAPH
jgi:hypothetical protein